MGEELAQMVRVLEISVPIFVLIGLGGLLRYAGLVTPKIQAFLSHFVYHVCLPVIIFFVVARADFPSLMNVPVISASLIGAVGTALIVWLLSLRSSARVRDPLVVSTFFANTAFIGFPLVKSAFPQDGMMYAGLVNAVVMPVYYIFSVLLMGSEEEGADQGRVEAAISSAIQNPVLLAAIAGLVVSAILHGTNISTVVGNWPGVPDAVAIAQKTGDMIGQMGLPLALIAVGAALKLSYIRYHWGRMLMGAAGKLMIAPFIGLVVCLKLFPDMAPAAQGTTVLLLACPVAVGSYILSREMDVDDDYMAGALVMTTILAAFTIAFWLYILRV